MFWKRKPKFNPATKRMGWAEIQATLEQHVDWKKIIHIRNQYYRVPVNPAYVMREIESWKYEWIKDGRECEGFMDILKGKLAELGFADLLVMYVSLNLHSEKPEGKDHALAGFIQCERLTFGEPQTGKMILPIYNRINRIIY